MKAIIYKDEVATAVVGKEEDKWRRESLPYAITGAMPDVLCLMLGIRGNTGKAVGFKYKYGLKFNARDSNVNRAVIKH